MRVDSVDAFYLSMPEIRDIGDGSQDALLIRIRAGGFTGWGECEASPLTSIASLVCPMSHSACHPVLASVLGERLDDPSDIAAIVARVRARSLDLLQAAHTVSGVEIALWDVLGKALDTPVYELLGYRSAEPKTPYASVLFGESPQESLVKARELAARGFRAVKFGWGNFGRGSVDADADQVHAIREGVGPDAIVMIDAGTVWDEDVDAAALRLPALSEAGVLWLEEPFVSGAVHSYRALAARSDTVRLAAGEGSHNAHIAEQLIDHGGIGFIQIDSGRVGGIGESRRVVDYAAGNHVQYVNHTFTSDLALSASLQSFAGSRDDWLCEYPVELQPLAREITRDRIAVDVAGEVRAPQAPGLGVEPDLEAIGRYLVDVQVTVGGKVLYSTPSLT